MWAVTVQEARSLARALPILHYLLGGMVPLSVLLPTNLLNKQKAYFQSRRKYLWHLGHSTLTACLAVLKLVTTRVSLVTIQDKYWCCRLVSATDNCYIWFIVCVLCELQCISQHPFLCTSSGVNCIPTNVTITPSPNKPLDADEAVTLQCSAVDPTGSGLSYWWFKDDVLILNESSSALVLSAVGPDEIGVYACHVSNRVGMEKQGFDLTPYVAACKFPPSSCT